MRDASRTPINAEENEQRILATCLEVAGDEGFDAGNIPERQSPRVLARSMFGLAWAESRSQWDWPYGKLLRLPGTRGEIGPWQIQACVIFDAEEWARERQSLATFVGHGHIVAKQLDRYGCGSREGSDKSDWRVWHYGPSGQAKDPMEAKGYCQNYLAGCARFDALRKDTK